ncbi:TonB-dependent receptor [Porphyromonas sp.]|uniref:TonB-dependent receptor n=1 Tax=Porphyromonas sp. TaxID=1924944 RepID=UPI0026DCE4DC|nr:TonB-dependent receptor [Porphyromonas sp.]MDO4695684.1 TonB-dependent receptor [Porphyromonas sp.]MDO4771492.1 TonB-dependent receptor [Porphyromonas sp.]
MIHRKITLTIALVISFTFMAYSQTGTIKGRLLNARSNGPVEFATIMVQGFSAGSTSDIDGKFVINNVKPGFFKLMVRAVGFEPTLSEEIQVQGNQTTYLEIPVEEFTTSLQEVTVRPNLLLKRVDSPLSVLSLGVQQIEKSAGANRDISKLVQTLPGVGATDPNRNDLIVRGGGPAENVFYLDGIELPVINHFSTQGASGGVVGIINPDFIREITFYTGAFPANKANTLSSVMDIKQREGNKDRIHTKVSIGASDAALTIDGPLGKNSTFIVSARQSYLQFLFKAIKLPFLPTYNDFQIKYKHQINPKNEISITTLGAIDHMTLNRSLEKTGTESQKYLLSYLPEFKQWNYTIGAIYKHFGDRHIDTWVLSRNMLRNSNYKYMGNDKNRPKISEYLSDEVENKLRYERAFTALPFKLLTGVGIEYANYTNETERLTYTGGNLKRINYNSTLSLFSYQAFAQVSKDFFDNRLKLSLGANLMGNTYNRNMKNPLNQLSPRFSISYAITPKLDMNGNIGRYAMQPAYTTLGFKDEKGVLVNQHDGIKYIKSDQTVLGLDYRPNKILRLSVEGFYKYYHDYPLSLSDSISLASKGVEYGQVGDEAISSTEEGRAYGIEFVGQVRSWHNLDITATYTLFRSEFTNGKGQLIPSSWDTKHMLNIMASYKIGKDWNIATRWRYIGGAPYSPIDVEKSTDKKAWSINNQAYIDYKKFNQLRLPASHQLDIRVDKEFYFKKWMLNLYVDIQNVYNFKSTNAPIYTNKDEAGKIMEDPKDPSNRQLIRELHVSYGTILPTIGIITKF